MPASRKRADLTSQSAGSSQPLLLPPIILFHSSNLGLPGEGRNLLPGLPHQVSPSPSVSSPSPSVCLPGSVCVAASHNTSHSLRTPLGQTCREACRPGALCVSTYSHTRVSPRLPWGSRQGRLTFVPRCSQPSALALALPQPCCLWGPQCRVPLTLSSCGIPYVLPALLHDIP